MNEMTREKVNFSLICLILLLGSLALGQLKPDIFLLLFATSFGVSLYTLLYIMRSIRENDRQKRTHIIWN